MVKQFKIFLTVLCFLGATMGFANSVTPEPSPTETGNPDLYGCAYPAPSNYQIAEIGTHYAKLTWTQYGAPPSYYNIIAYQVGTGTILANFNFPYANTVTVNNLPPGTNIGFILTALCPDGTLSQFPAITIGSTIILDLLVTGFNPNGLTPDNCTLQAANQFCYFNKNVPTRFIIYKDDNIDQGRQFRMLGNGDYQVQLNETNAGQDYQFFCKPATDPGPNGCLTDFVTIKKNGDVVAEFTVIHQAAQPTKALLICTSITPTYKITRLVGSGFRESSDKDDSEWVAMNDADHLSAAPNPFTNLLDVNIPFSSEGNDVQISLYNLQGRLMTTVRTPGGTPTHTLSTENLLPGFYLLRVDTGDRSETIKVMKTQ